MDATAPIVTIGANFGVLSDAGNPPDTDGAVGPNNFVELLNDIYRVYDKSGTVLQESTAQQFWLAAGPNVAGSFDPRVMYDPGSGRWFASAADLIEQPNHILLAVSNTSDPTQGWQSFLIPSDPTGTHWADFPRLAVDQDSVYVQADMFPLSGGNVYGTYVVVPKADLLQATPTAANATILTGSAFAATPAVAFDSRGSEPFLSGNLTASGILEISSVDGPPTSPTLDAVDRFVSMPPAGAPPPAIQKGTDVRIDTGPISSEIGSDPVLHDSKLFGVQGIEQNGRAAIRWFEIGDPLTSPVLLASGVINPPNLDVYYGSIAVNPLGEVVIGFTGSGADDYASAYAVAGTLNGDTLQLGDPILLKAGVAPYVAFSQRWGDYSATTYDPDNPTHFWTIQEWASGGTAAGQGQSSTEISEIIFAPPTPTLQTWFGGRGDFSDPQNWSPAGSPANTDTLVIDAGRVIATNLTITNPTLQLGSSATPPTLVLRDSTLAATDHIDVLGTARITVAGAVMEDGTIVSGDGSTLDVNGPGQGAQFVNNGEVETLGGSVRMNVAVTGQGTFDDRLAGTLEFTKAVGTGETVNLDAGLLILERPKDFAASIQDFNAASTIELAHTKVTSTDYSDGVLTLFDNRRVAAQLNLVGDFTTDQFAVTNQGGNAFIMLDSQVAQLVSAMAAHTSDTSELGATAPSTFDDSALRNILAPTGHS